MFKLLLVLIVLGTIFAGYKYLQSNAEMGNAVLGIHDFEPIPSTTGTPVNGSLAPNGAQNIVDRIKQEVSSLSSSDVSSSSPQIQKIISDLKNLTSDSSSSGSAQTPLQSVCSIVCGK